MTKVLRLDIVLSDEADEELVSRIATVALSPVGSTYRGHEGLLVGRRTLWDNGTTVEPLDIWPSPVVDRDLPALP